MDVVSCKRFKPNETFENALNLSFGNGVGSENNDEYEIATAIGKDSYSRIFDDGLREMRNKFQQWVIETYRDSSKTKTITAKKYERIVRTLAGEIKNCAENSKFRFWMKCKGFKLVESCSPGETKILLVQDKKGEEIKYKKVAVVENFFDIIYDVHVNVGARGIKHAGQKRTHRTITETYAFLPREAVTRFLLCCVNCQKRTYDERKNLLPSPTISTSYDLIYPLGQEHVGVQLSCIDKSNLETQRSIESCLKCNDISKDGKENKKHDNGEGDDEFVMAITNYEHNNNHAKKEDGITEPFNFSLKLEPHITDTMMSCSIPYSQQNDNVGESTVRKCKRKRKITTKIVRSTTICKSEENIHAYNNLSDEKIPPPEIEITRESEFYKSTTSPQFEKINMSEDKCKSNAEASAKSNYTTDLKNCPYIGRICELLYNPVKYATDTARRNEPISNEDLLEKNAIDLILKARHLERIKGSLTAKEKEQISLQVYSCRIISYLLNYAADLLLKTMLADFTTDLNF